MSKLESTTHFVMTKTRTKLEDTINFAMPPIFSKFNVFKLCKIWKYHKICNAPKSPLSQRPKRLPIQK